MNGFHADFIAGISAGAVTTLVVHPLDLIKVRLQVDSSAANVRTRLRNAVFAGVDTDRISQNTNNSNTSNGSTNHKSFKSDMVTQRIRQVLTSTKNVTTEGAISITKAQVIKSLYRGLPINMIGNTISWGMYFSLYHHLKHQLIPHKPNQPLAKIPQHVDPNEGTKISCKDDDRISGFMQAAGQSPEPLKPGTGLWIQLFHPFWKFTETADQSTLYLICALVAGTSTSLMTNPIWVLKTRYLSTTSSQQNVSTRSQVNVRLTEIIKNEGIRSLWRGFLPGLFGVVQGSLQFTVYDEMKTRRLAAKHKQLFMVGNNISDKTTQMKNGNSITDINKQIDNVNTGKLDQWEYILISATSKIIATVSLYPYQLVRSRLQMGDAMPSGKNSENTQKHGEHRRYKNARDVVVQTFKYEGGLRALYKGLLPNLLRVVPSTTITFVVYENIQHWLKN